MLTEIYCSEFFQEKIELNPSLNVVLGDANSTNSLGKSTSLLVIDFAMGGNSYPLLAKSIIEKIGHHSIGFKFIFEEKEYYFVRLTAEPKSVFESNSEYIPGTRRKREDFHDWLKSKYNLSNLKGSWRSLVGVYSRVWGKKNYDVDKPLKGYIQDGDETSVNQLIKLFNKYDKITDAYNELQVQKDKNEALNRAFRNNVIRKITKREYEANKYSINEINQEIENIKNNLLKFTINVEELSSRELIELKSKKRELVEQKYFLANKIKRLSLSLSNSFRVDSKQFERLQLFFKNVNLQKIAEIEAFHSKTSRLLKNQIQNSIDRIKIQIDELDKELSIIDNQIDQLLEGVNSPKVIVERIFDLTRNVNELQTLNQYYEEKKDTFENVKSKNEDITAIVEGILAEIEKTINDHMRILNDNIYSINKKSPIIKLFQDKYNFDHSGNTGTGKSYIDLLLFDLTILDLTNLPFVIHDSFLFKNIEDTSVSNLILRYDTFNKQIFIAIDGIQKYSDIAQTIIKENVILELDDSKLLYGRDWR